MLWVYPLLKLTNLYVCIPVSSAIVVKKKRWLNYRPLKTRINYHTSMQDCSATETESYNMLFIILVLLVLLEFSALTLSFIIKQLGSI